MKIKITKDIPGYRAGEIIERTFNILAVGVAYHSDELVKQGFAEEIKEVDIEAIRISKGGYTATGLEKYCTSSEIQWFNSYRIVKTLIEELNGDWKADWSKNNNKWNISYFNSQYNGFELRVIISWKSIENIIPPCKDKEIALKVIKLCQPELEVLFNVK